MMHIVLSTFHTDSALPSTYGVASKYFRNSYTSFYASVSVILFPNSKVYVFVSVCWSVCIRVFLLIKGWMKFHEIFRKGRPWDKKLSVRFWECIILRIKDTLHLW